MPKAARIDDPISHSYAREGHAAGAAVAVGIEFGTAVALGAVVGSIACPGLGTLAGIGVGLLVFAGSFAVSHVMGLVGDFFQSFGEAFGAGINAECGELLEVGSPTVFINNKRAIRAGIDVAMCDKHSLPTSLLIFGAENIYINTFRAGREGDKVDCEAKISNGSEDVFFGGESIQVAPFRSREVPDSDRELAAKARFWAGILGGAAGAAKAGIKCFGTAVGFGYISAKVFGAAMPSFDGGHSAATSLGSSAGSAAARLFTGKPVHAVTGAKVLLGDDDSDFSLPGVLPIVWTRTYASTNAKTGILGTGWSLPFELELMFQDGKANFVDEQGRIIPFADLLPGERFYSVPEGLQISRDTAGYYYVAVPSAGWTYSFGPRKTGLETERLVMQDWTDRNNNAIVFHRDEAGLVKHISDTSGHRLALTYGSSNLPAGQHARLLHVDLLAGAMSSRLVAYRYTADGDLEAVVDRMNTVVKQFRWNNHIMVSQQFASGLLAQYDWSLCDPLGKVKRHWLTDMATGEQLCAWQFEYELPGESEGDLRTRITDHLGRITLFDHNANQDVTRIADPMGNVTRYEWDDNWNLVKLVQAGGQVFTMQYDGLGNPVQATDPLGQVASVVWHERLQLPIVVRAVDGVSWKYAYDERGNTVGVTGPQGYEQQWVYDARGLPLEHVDARSGRQHFTWTPEAQLLSSTDCSDKTTTYHYDGHENWSGATDALGYRTTRVNDPLGRPLSVSLPDGGMQGYVYDAAGRMVRKHNALQNGVSFQWDALDRLVNIEKPDGNRVAMGYDRAQRLAQLTNENNESFGFQYDAADRVVQELCVGGQRVSVEYDANGWPVAVTHHPGLGDELLSGGVGKSAGQTPEIEGWGDTTEQGDGLLHARRTEMMRDALGRLIEKRTRQHHYRYTYDAADRLVSAAKLQVRAGSGEAEREGPELELMPLHMATFEYDQLGSLIVETVTDETTGISHTLYHGHDALGNRTQTVLPSLSGQQGTERALNYLYYGSGHLHQINFSQRRIDATDAEAIRQLICDMERDDLHQEIWRSQGTVNTRFAYDPMGRVSGAWSQSASLNTQAFGPQDSGQAAWQQALQSLQQPNSSSASRGPQGLLKTWQYDKGGELRASRHSLKGDTGYRYDPVGQILQTQHAPLVGAANSFTQASNESFGYDPAGNIQDAATKQAVQSSTSLSQRGYVRDNLVRVFEDKRYFYDGHGRLIRKLTGKHTDQSFIWDEENLLTQVVTTRRPGTEHETTQTTKFDYDAIGRRVAKHDSFGTTTFIWSGMRLIEERRGAAAITYVYEPGSYVPLARLDANGDETNSGGLGTVQDQDATAAKAPAPGAAGTSLAVNSSASAANDAEARYLASLNQASYQRAESLQVEGWSTGTDGAVHSSAMVQGTLCEVYYFHTDQVGMPQELSNSQGQLVWQASYKTWGSTVAEEWEIKSLAGNAIHQLDRGDIPKTDESKQQNLRFQGQYLDRDTGLHYNTFRYYDPDMGRFICPDPIGLSGGMNLGSYAPNPIGWIDPWGWACIPNKVAGTAREARVGTKLEGKFGKPNVLSERYLRDVNGKIVRDPVTGTARRIDFVVKGADGKWKPIEVTSRTADKTGQLTKEISIRNSGGTYVRMPGSKILVPVEGTSRVIRLD